MTWLVCWMLFSHARCLCSLQDMTSSRLHHAGNPFFQPGILVSYRQSSSGGRIHFIGEFSIRGLSQSDEKSNVCDAFSVIFTEMQQQVYTIVFVQHMLYKGVQNYPRKWFMSWHTLLVRMHNILFVSGFPEFIISIKHQLKCWPQSILYSSFMSLDEKNRLENAPDPVTEARHRRTHTHEHVATH